MNQSHEYLPPEQNSQQPESASEEAIGTLISSIAQKADAIFPSIKYAISSDPYRSLDLGGFPLQAEGEAEPSDQIKVFLYRIAEENGEERFVAMATSKDRRDSTTAILSTSGEDSAPFVPHGNLTEDTLTFIDDKLSALLEDTDRREA